MSKNNLTAIAKDNMVRSESFKTYLLVANSIVNKNVKFCHKPTYVFKKRVSKNVLKVLNAAVANAENNKQLDIDNFMSKKHLLVKV